MMLIQSSDKRGDGVRGGIVVVFEEVVVVVAVVAVAVVEVTRELL